MSCLSAEQLARIRASLPAGAFQPDPRKLLWMALHVLVVAGMYFAVRYVGLSPWLLACGIVAAGSLSCLGFHAHDLAHGSIVRAGRMQRGCELFFWGLLLVAPTIWRRVHNQAHHAHFNTAADPDRQFFSDEASTSTRWYTRLLYPNDEVFPWNPLVFVHFIPYVVRNTLAALLPAQRKPACVPNRPAYLDRDFGVIARELLAIAALQAGLFLLSGGRWWPWLILTVTTQALTSCISMSYIFTNHFLNPLTHEPDPITGTTSVIVPRWVDRLHAHFSYHTEHHLFPKMNSDYYPLLSQRLRELYPATYQRIPMGDAWRRLWRNRAFVARGQAS